MTQPNKRTLLLISMAVLLAFQPVMAKKQKEEPAKPAAAAPQAPAPGATQGRQAMPTGPMPYSQLITKDTKTMSGLITVHVIRDRYYFEIPDTLTGRDLLTVTRIRRSPAEITKARTGYPGDQVNEQVIQFLLAPNHKLFICEPYYGDYASDSSQMSKAVSKANMTPVVMSFDIKAYNRDTVSKHLNVVIDVTDYIMKSDRGMFAFDETYKKNARTGPVIADASVVIGIKSFPENVEIRFLKTFARSAPPANDQRAIAEYNASSPSLTYELNTSLVLLPNEPMKARLADGRVGYFAYGYTDYSANPQGIERCGRITRWRMEPKPGDEEKYLAGELVEPRKPIVIYIDPATPKQWVPYLIQGINDWQTAFEHAGFKNAIRGEVVPQNAPWSLEDARHSVLVYKPSEIANASGPHIHDPRSGEIIETHINWYHNVMETLRHWYTVQAGAVDPRTHQAMLPDSLMGELIRFVSSHEVGHTLGLRHNFGSSATVPVEKLRDKEWVEANGHTPSIMDYARFNYVAQPEDNIGDAGIFPRIGIYDKWAIEWGYRWLPQFKTPEEEETYLGKLIEDKLAEDKRYTFGGESDPYDPRNQNEDLGDNAMTAGAYGILNLQRIVPNIIDWMKQPNKDHSNARDLYSQVVSQYARYMGHAATNIGGVYTTPVASDSEGKAKVFVPAALQRQAVDFLGKQLFTTPKWLVDPRLIDAGAKDPVMGIASIQASILNKILNRRTIDCLSNYEAFEGKNAYTAGELFASLRKSIMTELTTGATPDLYRRNLQEVYVKALISMVVADPAAMPGMKSVNSAPPSDAPRLARAQLIDLNREIKSRAAASGATTRAHYLALSALIDNSLDPR